MTVLGRPGRRVLARAARAGGGLVVAIWVDGLGSCCFVVEGVGGGGCLGFRVVVVEGLLVLLLLVRTHSYHRFC